MSKKSNIENVLKYILFCSIFFIQQKYWNKHIDRQICLQSPDFDSQLIKFRSIQRSIENICNYFTLYYFFVLQEITQFVFHLHPGNSRKQVEMEMNEKGSTPSWKGILHNSTQTGGKLPLIPYFQRSKNQRQCKKRMMKYAASGLC